MWRGAVQISWVSRKQVRKTSSCVFGSSKPAPFRIYDKVEITLQAPSSDKTFTFEILVNEHIGAKLLPHPNGNILGDN